MRYSLFFILIFFIQTSQAVQKVKKNHYLKREVIRTSNLVIPFEVKKIIESQVMAEGESLDKDSKRENLPIEVVITQEIADNVYIDKLLSPKGQGRVDLFKYLKKGAKGFNFALRIKTENLSLDDVKVFFKPFMSKKNKKKCNDFLDITSFYHRIISKGFDLVLKKEQYLRVLAGQYFFVVNNKKRLHIALLEVTHSKYKHHLDCY